MSVHGTVVLTTNIATFGGAGIWVLGSNLFVSHVDKYIVSMKVSYSAGGSYNVGPAMFSIGIGTSAVPIVLATYAMPHITHPVANYIIDPSHSYPPENYRATVPGGKRIFSGATWIWSRADDANAQAAAPTLYIEFVLQT